MYSACTFMYMCIVAAYDYATVMQGDTLAPYLFIICRDYILQTSIDIMKENVFSLENRQEVGNTLHKLLDADYADDITLPAFKPTQAKSQLHSLEQAANGIGLRENADKTEYVCFNQKVVAP